MSNTMREFIKTLKTNPNHAFDFVANNYWKMGNEELAYITKELLYAVYDTTSTLDHDTILYRTGELLEDWYEDYFMEEEEEVEC